MITGLRSVLITGSNRGLGLEFVKQFLALPLPPAVIFATCRDVDKATALREIADSSSTTKIVIHPLDVTSPGAIEDLVTVVDSEVKEFGLNLLINNAGFYDKSHNGDVTTFNDPELLAKHFAINSTAPVMITRAFVPLLARAAKNYSPFDDGKLPVSAMRSGVVNLGTKMASIADNTSGGSYPYRMSKVALHMATRSMAIELLKQGILVLLLHPGWVRTDMGGSNGLIDAEESVGGMMNVITFLGEEGAGVCYDYAGMVVPW